MEIFKSNYQTINYDSGNLVQTWAKESKTLTDELFKAEMIKLGEAFDNQKPQTVLINMADFVFTVAPEVQEWVNKNVNYKLIEISTKKLAFIVSTEIFTAISVEQTLDEDEGAKLNTQFFDKKENAEKWLAE